MNFLLIVLGVIFIILAVIGALLPFVPGFIFLIIGIMLLGEEFCLSRWIMEKSLQKLRKKIEKNAFRNEWWQWKTINDYS